VCLCACVWLHHRYFSWWIRAVGLDMLTFLSWCTRLDFAGSRRGGAYRLSASRVSKGSRFSKTACRQCVCVLSTLPILCAIIKRAGFDLNVSKDHSNLSCHRTPEKRVSIKKYKPSDLFFLFFFFFNLFNAFCLWLRARVISLYYVRDVGLEKHRHMSLLLYTCTLFLTSFYWERSYERRSRRRDDKKVSCSISKGSRKITFGRF